MEEKQDCIRRELDEVFREWSAGAAFIGSAIFLLLSPLDFYAVPEHAARFLGYRLAIAAVLVVSGAILRRPRSRGISQGTVFLSVLASAAVLEAMILDYGGHHSPYLIGLILLAVTVLGLIPANLGFASLLAVTLFVIYVGPILAWDTLHDPRWFVVEIILFAAILAIGILINWMHRRRLAHEISLRYDLTMSRERLEEESAQRAQAVAELRRSQGLLSSIAAAMMDAIVMIDPKGTLRYWNPAAEHIFGHTAEEAIGRGAFDFLVAPEKAEEMLTDHRAWLASGERPAPGRRVVTRGRRSSGEIFPMEMTLSAVEREGSLWTCGLLRDVTEQVHNEERLQLFMAAVESAAESIFILDLEGRVIFCNAAAAAQSGRTPADIVGQDIRQMYLDPSIHDDTIVPALRRTGSWSGDFTGAGPGGQPLMVWLSASLIRDAGGRAIAMVGITKDLSEQRRLEEERIKIQKLESIGVLAGGLAHDFNNLLTIILGNVELARHFAGADAETAEALDHAGEAALRAGDLTRQLITFSKGGVPVKRAGDIARTVRETVALAAAGSNISCSYELSADLPAIDFDEGQMRQVVHNLVQNAREAMSEGGTLRVSAHAVQVLEEEIQGLPAGRYVRLQFNDRGSGIAPAHLALIFDPYFSTKEMDTVKGRGLGLAISFSIVRNHGGTITAESSPAGGTTISVYLPESERAPEVAEGNSDRGVVRGAGGALGLGRPEPDVTVQLQSPPKGRVLVMDDEPLVLEMAGAMLRRLGYGATLARTGAETIVQYQIAFNAGRRFAAVVLDLTVPGSLGGLETLARLREIDPSVRAILSSGHIEHPVVADWAGAGFVAFIAKPYSIKDFEEALARLF